jgi:hypothetical protein
VQPKGLKLMNVKTMKSTDYITENKVKTILRKHLISEGWHAQITQRKNYSLDIEASRGKERWIIEVSGLGTPDFVNSFVTVFGEILQRMDDPRNKYSVAFPDMKPFRRLWERLPTLAKNKIGVTALFVDQTGIIDEIAL